MSTAAERNSCRHRDASPALTERADMVYLCCSLEALSSQYAELSHCGQLRARLVLRAVPECSIVSITRCLIRCARALDFPSYQSLTREVSVHAHACVQVGELCTPLLERILTHCPGALLAANDVLHCLKPRVHAQKSVCLCARLCTDERGRIPCRALGFCCIAVPGARPQVPVG